MLLKSILKRAPEAAIPFALGVIAFFVTTGGRLLAPRNIAWLSQGDSAAYFLGWQFFRNTPWSFPLGLNPRYGAELANAIMFSDNVPAFAFVSKALRSVLPDVCQYLGFWLLCCFVLQAWFAWLLVGLLTQSRLARACGTVFFVLAPPFLWRLQGHYMMNGQWLLLAALYVTFGRRPLARGMAWPVLALTVSVVHSYLTAMILGLWLADWLRRILFEGWTRSELMQLVLVPCAVLLGFWQAGFFTVGPGITKSGFGEYRMNVLSLVDSSGWSYLLKDIPEGKGDYEGFNFLGLGGILLALLAVPALKNVLPALRAKRQYWPLLGLCIALTLFAISNRIGFGSFTFEIPLPQSVIDRANTLRGCGRMFWPVFYVLLWVMLRALLRRYPPRVARVMLSALVVIQALDISAGWRPIRRDLMIAGPTWASPLKAAFWEEVPSRYHEIRLVPPRNQAPDYEHFAYFAAMHGMSTDAAYLSRMDSNKLKQAKRDAMLAVHKGNYAPNTLYVLDRRYARAARRSMHAETDLLASIDGFMVLAPGWKCRPECAANMANGDCSAKCPDN